VQFSVRQLLIYGIMIFRRAHSMHKLQLLQCARKCSPPNSANK